MLTRLMMAAALAPNTPAMAADMPEILSLKERAALEDRWLAERLETVIPALMREQNIDMWILIAREYAEDPVVETMLDAKNFHARRRTILVFADDGESVERLTVSRYGLAGLFEPAWVPEEQPDQWARLSEIVAARDPERIAVNVSAQTALADGLTHAQYEGLMAALPESYRKRVIGVPELAIGWLETRTPAEIEAYDDIVAIAHGLVATAFSDAVVTPGSTTANDVRWWLRERVAELKMTVWFHPSVGIWREGTKEQLSEDTVIQPGDLLWTDFGITYLGLNTDTQQLAYVLKPGESGVPTGLKAGLLAANDTQDALTSSFQDGLSGNDILAATRAKTVAAGLDASIYSHPLGYHGHGAGPAIGFWDNQEPTPAGDYLLRPMTGWSIELATTSAVAEWGGQRVPFRLEQDAIFDGARVDWLDERQTEFHLIGAGSRAPDESES